MKRHLSRLAMGLLGVALALFSAEGMAATAAQDPHAAHRAALRPGPDARETRVTLPPVVLRDAHGRPFALRPDSFGGRVVIVDFVFTRCTTICPALSAIMAATQRGLGGTLGKRVTLVSISVDPQHDTPAVLRAYAERVGAGEHWRWLTGGAGDIARVLDAFGLPAGRPDQHPPLILVGDPQRNRWIRWVGVPAPAVLVDTARTLSASVQTRTATATPCKEPCP